jgi:hypothetical protein
MKKFYLKFFLFHFTGRLHLLKLFDYNAEWRQQTHGSGRRGLRQQDVLPRGHHS